jgi:hypothetical protein
VHQSGGNRLLPAGRFNTNFLYGPAIPHEPAGQPAARWLAHFGGPLGFSGDFRSWTHAQLAAGRRYVDVFKRWRHALAGDFYPLFPLPRSLAEWDGWQFDDPQGGEGLIVAFREAASEAEVGVSLGGQRPNSTPLISPLGEDQAGSLVIDPAGWSAQISLPPSGAGAWSYAPPATLAQ